MSRAILVLAGLLSIFFGVRASAFPETVRHGYVNCTACHVAPSGGGTLTQYGRSLSKELMSTWGYENEETVLHGLIPEETRAKLEKVLFGGDIRLLQTYREDSLRRKAEHFPMQANVEAAVVTGSETTPVTLDLQVGEIEDPRGEKNFLWRSERYFAMVNWKEEYFFRLGRFLPAYGLQTPEHQLVIRTETALVPFLPRDTVEASWIAEQWNVFLGGSKTPIAVPDQAQETAFNVQVTRNFLDRHKVGVSFWNGRGPELERRLFGAHAILGFTPKFFALGEADIQRQPGSDSLLHFERLAYEATKGVIPFAQFQQSQALTGSGRNRALYGLGLQWFPRPHLELQTIANYIHAADDGVDAHVLLHYYF